jgi:hypothetical protein
MRMGIGLAMGVVRFMEGMCDFTELDGFGMGVVAEGVRLGWLVEYEHVLVTDMIGTVL